MTVRTIDEINAAIEEANVIIDAEIPYSYDMDYLESIVDTLNWVLGDGDHPLNEYM